MAPGEKHPEKGHISMPELTDNEYTHLVMEGSVQGSTNKRNSRRLITVSELQLVEALRLLEGEGPPLPHWPGYVQD